jgi:hypothetical protein
VTSSFGSTASNGPNIRRRTKSSLSTVEFQSTSDEGIGYQNLGYANDFDKESIINFTVQDKGRIHFFMIEKKQSSFFSKCNLIQFNLRPHAHFE